MARVHLTDLEGANTMYVTTRWYRAPEVLLVGNYSYSSMQPTFPCRPGLAAAPTLVRWLTQDLGLTQSTCGVSGVSLASC
jgi:hypothetical protein